MGMGMFDYVRCEVPLPDGYSGEDLQTKDFDCQMATHVIRADGLYLDDGYHEDVPKDQRPYPNAPDGSLEAFIGCMRWVTDLKHQADFHGFMNFYAYRNKVWHEYNAKFTDGKLIEIQLVPAALPTQEPV